MSQRFPRVRLFLFALVGAVFAADAQTWLPLSPDGGKVNFVVGEPGGFRRAYAADDNGLFVSDDAGRSWREGGRGLIGAPYAIAVYPPYPPRAYAFDSTYRLMRTENHGDDWVPTGYRAPTAGGVKALALTNDAVLYTPFSGSGIYRSTDGGATFARASGIPDNVWIGVIASHPVSPQYVIAGVWGWTTGDVPAALYRSTDGGANWAPLFPSLQSGGVDAIVFGRAGRVAAMINAYVYTSVDNGDTWTQRVRLDLGQIVQPTDDSDELVATNGRECYRSFDAFVTMQSCSDGLPTLQIGTNGFSSLATVRDGTPGSYRVLAALRGAGVLALESGASTWVASNRSLRADAARGLAILPHDSRRMIYGRARPDAYADWSLFGTVDAGATWTPSLFREAQLIRTIAFDPTTTANPATTVLYAAGSSIRRPEGNTTSGIYKSVDGGANWVAQNQGLPTFSSLSASGVLLSSVRKVVLDPRSCAAPPATGVCTAGPLNTVYVITNGSGSDHNYRVIKSVQGGNSWAAVGAGLPLPQSVGNWYEAVYPFDIKIDGKTGAVYVSMFGDYFSDDGNPQVPSIASGVFRSNDGGATWAHAANGLPLVDGSATTARDVLALAMHPRRSGVLWAATIRYDEGSRIYRTVDAGANWSAVGDVLADCDVRDLQVDTAAPDVIYAAGLAQNGTRGCIWRSENGGASWTALHANLPVGAVNDVRQQPQDRSRLVVATDRGVWHASAPSDKLFIDTLDD